MARDVKVNILGDSRDFSRAVGSAERDTSRLDGAFGRVAGGAARMAGAVALGAAGVAVAGGAVAMSFVRAAEESQQVSRQTAAVLESMGANAWTSASQVAALATEISNLTGLDDEMIQAGQNTLLTYGGITENFDRATRAMVDVAVGRSMDMTSAADLIGKALNDPAEGLQKLSRAGILFTDQQKDQIRAMSEVGDVAGAQRIMLEELERQFGGSAEAQATASQRLSTIWGNLQEDLGAKLLPIFEKVVDWLGDKLPQAIDVLGRWFNKVKEWWPEIKRAATPVIEAYVDYMKRLIEGFKSVVAWVQDNWPMIQEKISKVLNEVSGFITTFVGYVKGAWQTFGDDIIRIATGVWEIVQQLVESAMRIVNGIINVVMGIIHGDWEQAWNGIKGVFTAIWDLITAALRGIMDVLKGIVGGAMNAISETFHNVWQGIYDFLAGLLGTIVGSVRNAVNRIMEALGLLDRFDKQYQAAAARPPLYVESGFIGPLAPGQQRVSEGFIGPLPNHHTGGIFNAGGGRREGAAWLESGERIIPRGQTGPGVSGDGGPIHIQFILDGKVVVDSLQRFNRSNGPIQIRVA